MPRHFVAWSIAICTLAGITATSNATSPQAANRRVEGTSTPTPPSTSNAPLISTIVRGVGSQPGTIFHIDRRRHKVQYACDDKHRTQQTTSQSHDGILRKQKMAARVLGSKECSKESQPEPPHVAAFCYLDAVASRWFLT